MLYRFLGAVLLVLFSSVQQAQSQQLDRVIAIVNDEAVTFLEYQARYNRELLDNQNLPQSSENIDIEVLRALIDERIQAQVARERGLRVHDEDIDNALATMARNNNLSIAQLFEGLSDRGITEAEFRRSVQEQILIQRIVDLTVNSNVQISEQEVEYHLQAHKELYAANESYEISHLFVSTAGKTEAEAASDRENVEQIRQVLSQGMPFEKAVEDYSDGEKTDGGYIGWRNEDQLPELFLDSLRDAPIGGITDVIRSANGFHILKIHSREGDLKIVKQQRIRHILINPARKNLTETEARALVTELAGEIRAGADFSKIARLHSDDTTSAAIGGSLGWVNPGDMVPPFESAAKLLEIDELSDPVKSRFGYHLIEVEERREKDISQDIATQQAYEEVYKRKQRELFNIWFGRIRDRTYIEMVAEL